MTTDEKWALFRDEIEAFILSPPSDLWDNVPLMHERDQVRPTLYVRFDGGPLNWAVVRRELEGGLIWQWVANKCHRLQNNARD